MKPKPRSATTFLMVPVVMRTSNTSRTRREDARPVREGDRPRGASPRSAAIPHLTTPIRRFRPPGRVSARSDRVDRLQFRRALREIELVRLLQVHQRAVGPDQESVAVGAHVHRPEGRAAEAVELLAL